MNILVCTEIKIHKITESLEVYFGFVSKKLRGISSIDYRLRSEKMAQSGTLLAGPLAAAHVGAKKQCYLRQWRLPPPPPFAVSTAAFCDQPSHNPSPASRKLPHNLYPAAVSEVIEGGCDKWQESGR